MKDLGTLGGSYSVANEINEKGQVAGYSQIAGDSTCHAFIWENGVMQDLGTLGGSYSVAQGINEKGQVIGYSKTTGDSSIHAFIWEDTTPMATPTTLTPTSTPTPTPTTACGFSISAKDIIEANTSVCTDVYISNANDIYASSFTVNYDSTQYDYVSDNSSFPLTGEGGETCTYEKTSKKTKAGRLEKVLGSYSCNQGNHIADYRDYKGYKESLTNQKPKGCNPSVFL